MHDDDKKWCNAMLDKLPTKYKVMAMKGYAEVYEQAYKDEPYPVKKEGAARRAANTRLRHFVSKIL